MTYNLEDEIDFNFSVRNYLNQYSDEGIRFTIRDERVRKFSKKERNYLGLGNRVDRTTYYEKSIADLEMVKRFCQRRWEENSLTHTCEAFISRELKRVNQLIELDQKEEFENQLYPIQKYLSESLFTHVTGHSNPVLQHRHPTNQARFDSKEVSTDLKKSYPYFDPVFIPEIARIFSKFSNSSKQELITVLQSPMTGSKIIHFECQGAQLADAFKELFEQNIVTKCNKSELEAWILQRFTYKSRGKTKQFTRRYLNRLISTKGESTKNPILMITKVEGKSHLTDSF